VKTVYVGNLNFKTSEEELRKAFEPFGVVELITMPRDTATGRIRGFAFVEMQDEAAAVEAIRTLNGSQLGGRSLVVNAARPKADSAREPRGDGERRFGRG
jgi:cold-inducible RNA-binding protein